MIDLEQAGLAGEQDPQGDSLPSELLDEEFLNSPVGRIMQALAALELAVKSFDARIGQCETYLTYLLSKDPKFAQKIHEMSKKNVASELTPEAVNEGQAK